LATNAQLDIPQGTTFDAMGNLYIADQGSARIRKVNTVGIITTIAGGGSSLGDGGPATAAGVSTFGVAIDALGNLYIADAAQNRIRRVNTAGIINTIVGNGTAGNIGDGGICTAAELNYPTGVAFDPEGNLYIADSYNNRIRRVTTLGIISTIAGNGTSGYTGDGGQATSAELNQPTVVTFDAAGNLFIADMFNGVIRKVNSMGIISTVAGVGTNGFTGDGGQATAAKLDDPSGVAFDSFGNLYIADTGNNRIRKVPNIGQAAGIEQFVTNKEGVNIYPNPTAGILNVACLMPNENSTLVMCDMLGNTVKQASFNTQHLTLHLNDVEAGVYFITVTSGASISTQKVIVSK
jgi:sugar lactone lactonase YvrE